MRMSWVEVDLGTLKRNIAELRRVLRRDTAILFVVKDRAYGHGLAPVARAAAESGVEWFGVVFAEEARKVREAAPKSDILVLGVTMPDEVPLLLENRATAVVVDLEHGRALADAAARAGGVLPVHLKLDTGMGRLGVLWEQAPEVFRTLDNLPSLRIAGVCTHLASVELRKPSSGGLQLQRFFEVAGALDQLAGRRLFKHVSSSRAILYHEEWDLDAVRPGILLYGYGTGESHMRFRTRPWLQWKAVVVQVKDVPAQYPIGYYGTYVTPAPTRIAVVGAGYADGYHRALSNKGFVLIRGRRCPVIGRVSMNWITVDLGPNGPGERGDEAVLIGEQEGCSIWADELAKLARTIPYELLTSISPQAERRYRDGNSAQ